MLKKVILILMIFVIIVGCNDTNVNPKTNNPNTDISKTEIWTLKVGNYWKYSSHEYSSARNEFISTIDTITYRIIDTININNKTWFTMNINGKDQFYCNNQSDGFWIINVKSEHDTNFPNSFLLFKYPAVVGDAVINPLKGDSLITKNINYPVSNSLGSFSSIYYESKESETSSKYKICLVPKIGLWFQHFITNIDINQTPSDTIWKYQDLIEYQLK